MSTSGDRAADDAETALDCLDNAIECGVENWLEVRGAIAALRASVARSRSCAASTDAYAQNKTPKTVYLVMGATGVGGDASSWCVGAFLSGDDALAFARRANEWLKGHKALRWVGTGKLKIRYERRVEIMNARPDWLSGLKVDSDGACFDVSEPVALHAASS